MPTSLSLTMSAADANWIMEAAKAAVSISTVLMLSELISFVVHILPNTST